MIATAGVNIASHLADMARRQPDAPAILIPAGRDASGDLRYARLTCGELNDRSDALARGLRRIGIARGDRTALCLRPGVDFFAVTFALFKLGAVPVLIDPGIGLRNFGRCLADAQPTAFIGIPLAHLLRRALRWSRNTIRINVTTGIFGGRPLRDVQRLGQDGASVVLPDTAPTDPAAILFTSGSTGPPKGVLYTHANFDAQVRALRDAYHIQPGEVDLATFPLFGLFGPALGMTVVIPEMDFTRPGHVEPQNIIHPIQQLNVTNLFGSPALLDRVGQWAAARGVKLPSLRRVISAGAPVPATVIERFASTLAPGVQVHTPYGATESLPVSTIASDEILADTRRLTDLGQGVCVGRPAAGMDVRIIGITDDPIPAWSDDLQLPPGQIGEIAVRGPVVTAEYFNRPQATALAKIPDPATATFFHRMGDVGYFDYSGRLWFCGRKSQRVRLPAGDLFSTPFEAVFNTHPLVARSALVGVERAAVTRPVICIERTPAGKKVAREKIKDELRALAQKHEHTRIINDFLFHPRFPVDIRHNAKIGREKLTAWAAKVLP